MTCVVTRIALFALTCLCFRLSVAVLLYRCELHGAVVCDWLAGAHACDGARPLWTTGRAADGVPEFRRGVGLGEPILASGDGIVRSVVAAAGAGMEVLWRVDDWRLLPRVSTPDCARKERTAHERALIRASRWRIYGACL